MCLHKVEKKPYITVLFDERQKCFWLWEKKGEVEEFQFERFIILKDNPWTTEIYPNLKVLTPPGPKMTIFCQLS